ncbi:MAG: 3-oxoacyl-ACP reductase FabG [Candidatus Bipolaricaulota bacterium]|nr:3-oxoacyl-ACP reductase FabG [Candidatus Bipolaricaulota bacterium]MBS3791497.1 3-oxoacyl-ACP reductase FabG [Candidatus Bipolaricaulota bacterium]
MEYSGEVAIVTGGGSGIGEGITRGLVDNGLKTYIFSRSRGEDTADEIGKNCHFLETDVTDLQSVESSVQETFDRHGRLDYLVNNAGFTSDNLLLRMSPEEWGRVIDVNLNGVFNCTRASLRYLIKGGGSIVNVSSVSGLLGNPGQANYSASKSAIVGFTKTLAQEYGKRELRANVVAPGFVDTRLTEDIPEDKRSSYLDNIILKRFAAPEEIAQPTLFLLSDKASYITGTVLRVDGGLSFG